MYFDDCEHDNEMNDDDETNKNEYFTIEVKDFKKEKDGKKEDFKKEKDGKEEDFKKEKIKEIEEENDGNQKVNDEIKKEKNGKEKDEIKEVKEKSPSEIKQKTETDNETLEMKLKYEVKKSETEIKFQQSVQYVNLIALDRYTRHAEMYDESPARHVILQQAPPAVITLVPIPKRISSHMNHNKEIFVGDTVELIDPELFSGEQWPHARFLVFSRRYIGSSRGEIDISTGRLIRQDESSQDWPCTRDPTSNTYIPREDQYRHNGWGYAVEAFFGGQSVSFWCRREHLRVVNRGAGTCETQGWYTFNFPSGIQPTTQEQLVQMQEDVRNAGYLPDNAPGMNTCYVPLQPGIPVHELQFNNNNYQIQAHLNELSRPNELRQDEESHFTRQGSHFFRPVPMSVPLSALSVSSPVIDPTLPVSESANSSISAMNPNTITNNNPIINVNSTRMSLARPDYSLNREYRYNQFISINSETHERHFRRNLPFHLDFNRWTNFHRDR